jgi:hypothetical protein
MSIKLTTALFYSPSGSHHQVNTNFYKFPKQSGPFPNSKILSLYPYTIPSDLYLLHTFERTLRLTLAQTLAPFLQALLPLALPRRRCSSEKRTLRLTLAETMAPFLQTVPAGTEPMLCSVPEPQRDQVLSELQVMAPSVQLPDGGGLVGKLVSGFLAGGGGGGGGVVLSPGVEPPEPPPEPGWVSSQLMLVMPSPTTSEPGFLNLMAWVFSGTVQPLPMFARNMVGRASKPFLSLLLPLIMTVAHFMYISRLPLLLNQVLLLLGSG